ncbi:MAG: hypothetical protein M0Q15_02340 [Nevskia sp.]|jgi:hypothetical protein|nr:hypothetical protein [Nevskia sp.]
MIEATPLRVALRREYCGGVSVLALLTVASVIDPAIKYLNKDGAMPNRMPHFRESEKWPDQ